MLVEELRFIFSAVLCVAEFILCSSYDFQEEWQCALHSIRLDTYVCHVVGFRPHSFILTFKVSLELRRNWPLPRLPHLSCPYSIGVIHAHYMSCPAY